jgi:hypothetical protein
MMEELDSSYPEVGVFKHGEGGEGGRCYSRG